MIWLERVEGNSTKSCIRDFSFLLARHREPQSSSLRAGSRWSSSEREIERDEKLSWRLFTRLPPAGTLCFSPLAGVTLRWACSQATIKQRQTFTTHDINRHCRVRFYTCVGQPLSKPLYIKQEGDWPHHCIQTPRVENTTRSGILFGRTSWCFRKVLSVWYIFSIEAKTKQKTEKGPRVVLGWEKLCLNMTNYYMEESVWPGTKPLVDSKRHFIRDPSGVFSVCHLSLRVAVPTPREKTGGEGGYGYT